MYNWDSSDKYSLAEFLLNSGMPLTDSENRLLDKLLDEFAAVISVYDLHEANILCWQAVGYLRANKNK